MSHHINRSSGGIVFGGGGSGVTPDGDDPAGVVRALRRRWASGVVVVTVATDGRMRGLTATSFMVVSEEPSIVAVAIAAEGEFALMLAPGGQVGISLLDASHEFPAERFAGRAPVPDAALGGISHRLEDGVPILDRSPGWCVGTVAERIEVGDHLLVLIAVVRGGTGEDTDDPLLRYEGGYRRLEVS